jgi:hypothetical protein
MKNHRDPHAGLISRRTFLQSTASAAALSSLTMKLPSVFAAGSDELKLGVVGCGGRGTGAATQALTATQTRVKLWAMADLFRDRLEASYKQLAQGGKGRYDREDLGSFQAQPGSRQTGFQHSAAHCDSRAWPNSAGVRRNKIPRTLRPRTRGWL